MAEVNPYTSFTLDELEEDIRTELLEKSDNDALITDIDEQIKSAEELATRDFVVTRGDRTLPFPPEAREVVSNRIAGLSHEEYVRQMRRLGVAEGNALWLFFAMRDPRSVVETVDVTSLTERLTERKTKLQEENRKIDDQLELKAKAKEGRYNKASITKNFTFPTSKPGSPKVKFEVRCEDITIPRQYDPNDDDYQNNVLEPIFDAVLEAWGEERAMITERISRLEYKLKQRRGADDFVDYVPMKERGVYGRRESFPGHFINVDRMTHYLGWNTPIFGVEKVGPLTNNFNETLHFTITKYDKDNKASRPYSITMPITEEQLGER